MIWAEQTLRLPSHRRGVHEITAHVNRALVELPKCRVGLLHLFLQHTSASLMINENASPEVLTDLELVFDRFAPENLAYRHTLEGPDDMPAHAKSAMLGCSLLVPVRQGQLALGTWQGIFLCEHRDRATPRTILLTLQGSE